MEIRQIYTGSPLRNFTYLIISGKSAISVDPFYADQVSDIINREGLELVALINTHEHGDHVCGNEALLSKHPCDVWALPDAENYVPGFSHPLENESEIPFGDGIIKVLATPGHTPGHLSLLCQKQGNPFAILCGDTLFNAGVGNCRNGGDPEILYQTITSIFYNLSDSVTVYPGHDYWYNNLSFALSLEPDNHDLLAAFENYSQAEKKFPQTGQYPLSTIGEERKINPFFRLNDSKIINAVSHSSAQKIENLKGIFLALRQLRDRW